MQTVCDMCELIMICLCHLEAKNTWQCSGDRMTTLHWAPMRALAHLSSGHIVNNVCIIENIRGEFTQCFRIVHNYGKSSAWQNVQHFKILSTHSPHPSHTLHALLIGTTECVPIPTLKLCKCQLYFTLLPLHCGDQPNKFLYNEIKMAQVSLSTVHQIICTMIDTRETVYEIIVWEKKCISLQ